MNAIDNAMNSQIGAARLNAGAGLPGTHGIDPRKIKETAQEFEAVFVSEMLRPMFDSIKTSEMFGGGNSEKVYRDMQVEEYGKAIAKAGGIGLADAVMREMIKMQEGN